MSTSISEVRAAFDRYVDLISRLGIPLHDRDLEPNEDQRPPRLVLSEGSSTYGIAYRVNVTDFPHYCQSCRARWQSRFGNPADHDLEPGTYDPACTSCNGTGVESCSGHARPPIGDDYLGMTKSEALHTLQERNATLSDVMRAVEADRVFIRREVSS